MCWVEFLKKIQILLENLNWMDLYILLAIEPVQVKYLTQMASLFTEDLNRFWQEARTQDLFLRRTTILP